MVLLGGAVAIWYFNVRPTAAAGGPGLGGTLLAFAYPLANLLVMLGVTTVLLRGPLDENRVAFRLLVISVTVSMVADLIFNLILIQTGERTAAWVDAVLSAGMSRNMSAVVGVIRQNELDALAAGSDAEASDLEQERRALDAEATQINEELRSLRGRQGNLPRRSTEIRAELCRALGVEAELLPFVGELLQVRPGAADWEGTAERVLRSFAMSLLVPEEHYGSVATWVDAQHLGAKLVYHRVPDRLGRRADTGRSGTARIAGAI